MFNLVSDIIPVNNAWFYILSVALAIAIGVLAFFMDAKIKTKITTTIAFAAICVALSFGLSYIPFFRMGPNGGSVTCCSLLPIMLFSYMFGTRKGVLACLLYGFLQFIQEPVIYHPLQFLLDYPIAFASIGLVGMFRNKTFLKGHMFLEFLLGAIVAVLFRYSAHVLSGYYVFGIWAWEGYSAIAYSLVYNLFCIVDMGIALVPGVAALSSKGLRSFIRNADTFSFTKKKNELATEAITESGNETESLSETQETESNLETENTILEEN